MRRFTVGLIVWVVLISTAVHAEDVPISFRIAPPPVGYPVLEAGARSIDTGADAVYTTIDTVGEKISFYGGTSRSSRTRPEPFSIPAAGWPKTLHRQSIREMRR